CRLIRGRGRYGQAVCDQPSSGVFAPQWLPDLDDLVGLRGVLRNDTEAGRARVEVGRASLLERLNLATLLGCQCVSGNPADLVEVSQLLDQLQRLRGVDDGLGAVL